MPLFPPSARRRRSNNRAMEPDRQEIDRVVARVVAWHNRHPLAKAISAAHVHSVGVVNLPFAVQGARVEDARADPPAAQPPAGPAEAAAAPPAAADVAAASAPPADEPASPPGEAVVELIEVVDDGDAPATPAEATAAPPGPEAADAARPSAPTAVAAAPATVAAPPAGAGPTGAGPAAPQDPQPARQVRPQRVTLPPRPKSSRLAAWWTAWRGQGPFRPLFTEDFAAPLSPGRIARWAVTHASADLPLGRDAQQRFVTLDPSRRHAGQGPEVELYLLTAAVGVGDRRLRVLLAPAANGPVIGPRHWNRPRVAAAVAAFACTTLIGVQAGLGGWRPSAPAVTAAAVPASAASASAPAAGPSRVAVLTRPGAPAASAASSASPVAAASAPAAVASTVAMAPLTASAAAWSASAVASAPAATASTPQAAPRMVAQRPAGESPAPEPAAEARTGAVPARSRLASAAPPSRRVAAAASPAASAALVAATAARLARATQLAPAASAPQAASTSPAPSVLMADGRPRDVEPRRGRIELPAIRPTLHDGDRSGLRHAGGALRREAEVPVATTAVAKAAAPPPARAFALVSRAWPDRRQPERVAAQLQAVALLQPRPMRAELMRTGGGWRAVFWPFASERDAEKVRMALADKGLRTEVIEF